MNQIYKPQIFTVSRKDLLYNYARPFEGSFRFATFETEEPSTNNGVRFQESPGYDFQRECSPVVEILPISSKLAQVVKDDPNDFIVNITLEDIGLSIRKLIYSIPVIEIQKSTRQPIDLTEHSDLSFHRGFEVKCFISRRNDVNEKNHIWSKSQIVYETSFQVKTSIEDALFEITWVDFSDEQDRKDVLYFVKWWSAEVSTDVACYQINANADLKDQFKRLEINRHFGEFCIRMIAEQILRELLHQCLRFAKLDDEPQPDSLHDKFSQLLSKQGEDFNELAQSFQSPDPIDQMNASSEITKILQRMNSLGSNLETIKFGGYR